MWLCPTKGTYVTLETNLRVDICPSEDIRPHTLFEGACACGAQASMIDNRLHVLHFRYAQTIAVEASMEYLFGKSL